MPKIFALLLLTLFSSASTRAQETWTPGDNLVAAVSDLQKSAGDSRCDISMQSAQLEIAADLDTRAKDMQDIADESDLGPSDAPAIRIGNFDFPTDAPSNALSGWQESAKAGWQELHTNYLKIRGQKTDQRWLKLNRQVRSILVDDHHRRVSLNNMYLNRDAGPLLEEGIAATAGCTHACPLSPSLELFFRGNPRYRPLLESSSFGELHGWLVRDNKRYAFQANPTVRRENPSTIVLPLKSEDLVGGEDTLVRLIEEIWSSNELSVRVEWRPNTGTDDNVYRFRYRNTAGSRAFVDHQSHTINFFLGTHAVAVAHELGHVLGFRDEYYTIWHPEDCRYITERSEEDIMSVSATGHALSRHWERLSRAYR